MTHKPYISPSLSLYHAQAHDVLRMLPENSVDALITDPPYSSGATHKAGRTCQGSHAKYINDEDLHRLKASKARTWTPVHGNTGRICG